MMLSCSDYRLYDDALASPSLILSLIPRAVLEEEEEISQYRYTHREADSCLSRNSAAVTLQIPVTLKRFFPFRLMSHVLEALEARTASSERMVR